MPLALDRANRAAVRERLSLARGVLRGTLVLRGARGLIDAWSQLLAAREFDAVAPFAYWSPEIAKRAVRSAPK